MTTVTSHPGPEVQADRLDADTMREAAVELEEAAAEDVVSWAFDQFAPGRITATASLQDCVLIDILARVRPGAQVVFFDTQYHFAETLSYLERVRARFDVNLEVLRPRIEPDDRWRTDPRGCCFARKVEPLQRALAGRDVWLSGLRRDESPARARTPKVAWDTSREVIKVTPLARWTDDDVDAYIADRDLPVHPLQYAGYPSIGCWPCTAKPADGADPRSGRWAGSAKTECGLHLPTG